jgi:Tol biopolymer transport system component
MTTSSTLHTRPVRRWLVVAPAVLLPLLAAAPRAQSGATTRVSVMTGCGKAAVGLGQSDQPAISDDGRFITFRSTATSLVPGDSTIAWFANLDGAGGFGPLQLVTTEIDQPTALATALIDADGALDVVTSSKLDHRIAWYYNGLTSSGEFAGPLDISIAMTAASAVETGDVDGDGDIDVLATAPDASSTSWFPNEGGRFGGGVTISPYGLCRTVCPADVDGDGDLDVLFANDFSTGEIAWYENRDGAGSFSAETAVTTAADDPWSVAAGDFDGDGDLDVVSASAGAPSGPRVQWYANLDGQGAFGAPNVLSTSSDPNAVGAGDLDGDGDTDILAGIAGDSSVVWYPNLGAGSFGPAITLSNTIASPSSVEAADLDGDGDRDVLIAATGNNEAAWFVNTDGQGSFGPKVVISAAVGLVQQVHAADVDADGDLDLLVASRAPDEISWFRNQNGLGSFSGKLVISNLLSTPRSVHAVDIDADGRLDVLSASSADDKIAWYRNLNGLGSFGPQQAITHAADGARSVIGVDLDGDGDGDVVSYAEVEAQLTWYDNTNGLGTAFVTHDLVPASTQPKGRAVVAADLDGDADPDLLTAGGVLGDISWFENPDGQAGFGQKHPVMTNTKSPRCVHGADVDGDGDVDVLSASFNDNKLAWSRNLDGAGSFGAQQVISTSVLGAVWVSSGDVDGDGDLDALATAQEEDRVSWFENMDGAGSFGAEHTVTATADQARQARFADLDGDGDLDVLVAAYGGDITTWHENLDGTGLNFAAHVIYDGPTVGATAVRAEDVDGDGDLDVLLASAAPGPQSDEVLLHDRYLLATSWVSKTIDGTPSHASRPSISSNGRYIVFESTFGTLVPGPDTNVTDIYLRDMVAETTERIDVSSAGVQANNVCVAAQVSGDGRYVAYESYADNLVPGDLTCCSDTDVFLRDRLAGTTIRVNERPDSTPPLGAGGAAISADGAFVAFVSGDPLLVPGDTNGTADVFTYATATGALERVSLGSGGTQNPESSVQPSLSGDGRRVAFRTVAALDAADTNPYQDIYVFDRQTLVTYFASISQTGAGANSTTDLPRLSADGRYVSFVSFATDLVPGTTGSVLRGYRRDLLTGTTELMSVASDGSQANAPIVGLDISGDGRLVAFDTKANNLVPSDTDDVSDVFVHGVDPWFPLGCDEPGSGGAALLQGSGPLNPATAGSLKLTQAKPSSFALLFVSLQSLPVAFKGGVLVAFPPTLQLPLFTGPAGGLTLNFIWPNGVPSGVKVYFHWAIADPAATQGVALSSAIRAVTP